MFHGHLTSPLNSEIPGNYSQFMSLQTTPLESIISHKIPISNSPSADTSCNKLDLNKEILTWGNRFVRHNLPENKFQTKRYPTSFPMFNISSASSRLPSLRCSRSSLRPCELRLQSSCRVPRAGKCVRNQSASDQTDGRLSSCCHLLKA